MLDRRKFLGAGAGAVVTVASATSARAQIAEFMNRPAPKLHGRIKQVLWRTVFGTDTTLTLDEMCKLAAHLGVVGFDLTTPEEWPVLRKYGLKPFMVDTNTISFEDGIIRRETHDKILADFLPWIDTAAKNDVGMLVLLGGEKRGMEPERALDDAVSFVNRIKPALEDKGVLAVIENINDRRPEPGFGRKDQVFGPFAWGVELVKRVNSPNFKLLCDVYHLQMQDGDLARTIKANIDSIAHFHVAGAPTRTEIDETQEVNYRYIATTIADTGFSGHVAHEWRPGPGRDPLTSLVQALEIMDG